jgi:threonine dehydratase
MRERTERQLAEPMTRLRDRVDPLRAMGELDGVVTRTPVRRLRWLERLVGVPVWAKLESQQETGSFKFRGAYLAVSRSLRGRPVIAASAGNHGLAVAEVGRRLGVRTDICIPTNASRLKRERIVATGAGLIEYGSSLEDAIDHAQHLARTRDLHFISPYNDPDVVAGNSTVAVELLEDVPGLDSIVVPMGGGGLISGMALGTRAVGSNVRVLGCHPERHQSLRRSVEAGEAVRVVPQPTLADGLAVTVEPGALTIPLVQEHVEELISLSEEELAASTLALLVHESLLVEPAGAAGIAACLRLAELNLLDGPVGIPLCGGNLHHTTLAVIQRYPYVSEPLIRLLDLRGRRVTDLPVAHSNLAPVPAAPDPVDDTPEKEVVAHLESSAADVEQCLRELQEFVAYCDAYGLLINEQAAATVRELALQVDAEVRDGRDRLLAAPGSLDELALAEAVFRWATTTLAYVRDSLEWCSPSFDQSRINQFFALGAQSSPTANYERYESRSAREVEERLVEVLGLPPERLTALVTSSGMAAYALIEAFVLRERLTPDDVVLMAPYVYFEASEQLLSLPWLKVVPTGSYDTRAIADLVEEHAARALFVDPITNTVDQRVIDIPGLVEELRRRRLGPVTVVVDGTMISGAIDVASLVGDGAVEVIYYESCSKYLQLGMDTSMAGVVAVPVELAPAFDRIRRNMGLILYRHGANLFPRFDRQLFLRRMTRICGNAELIAGTLAEQDRVTSVVDVVYPGHRSHVDHEVARRMRYAGGCVTFAFRDRGRNHRDELEATIEKVLWRARQGGLQLTKGVSFGFAVPRISAAASMAETEPPFLRLYAGDRGPAHSARLAAVLADVFTEDDG